MVKASAFGLKVAMKAWPRWFTKVAKRLPGVRAVARYGTSVIQPHRQLHETWEECFKRSCIKDAPKWIAERSTKVMNYMLALHSRHSQMPFPQVTRCPFCISKMTPKVPIPLDVRWDKYRRALQIAERCNARNLLITSKGEPTLHPDQITELLGRTTIGAFDRIELQTDGFTLLNNKRYPKILKKWSDYIDDIGIDVIAISCYHYDDDKNRKIFGARKSKYTPLRKMIETYRSYGFEVRLSCVMLKGLIDSISEVALFCGFAKAKEVFQMTFRKLGYSPSILLRHRAYLDDKDRLDRYYKFYRGYQKYRITDKTFYDRFIGYFDVAGDRIDVLPHGAIIWEYKRQNVCLTDCLTRDTGKEKVRNLIFYPNGWLCTSWEHPWGSRIL